jgi:hypothetical protein
MDKITAEPNNEAPNHSHKGSCMVPPATLPPTKLRPPLEKPQNRLQDTPIILIAETLDFSLPLVLAKHYLIPTKEYLNAATFLTVCTDPAHNHYFQQTTLK